MIQLQENQIYRDMILIKVLQMTRTLKLYSLNQISIKRTKVKLTI